jgi:hypothetical protein
MRIGLGHGRVTMTRQRVTLTPRLALAAVAGSLAYAGLAILAWGGFAAFFSHPARLVLAVVLFALTAVALFAGGNLSAGEREDRANRWVLAALGLLGLLEAYWPAYNTPQRAVG